MSRTYSKRACWLCKTLVSSAGGAFAAHMKKHAKEPGVIGDRARKYLGEQKTAVHLDFMRRHGVKP